MRRRDLLELGLGGSLAVSGCLEAAQNPFRSTEKPPCAGVDLNPDFAIQNMQNTAVSVAATVVYTRADTETVLVEDVFEVRAHSEIVRGRLFDAYFERGDSPKGMIAVNAEEGGSVVTEDIEIRSPATTSIKGVTSDDGPSIETGGIDSTESRSSHEECYWDGGSPVVSS